MNIYIIGPVTGIPKENRPEFERVRKILIKSGYEATIPHDVIPKHVPWKEAMHLSIQKMLSMWSFCDICDEDFGIATLDDWENSNGARIEHDLAEALDIPCKPWREWLE